MHYSELIGHTSLTTSTHTHASKHACALCADLVCLRISVLSVHLTQCTMANEIRPNMMRIKFILLANPKEADNPIRFTRLGMCDKHICCTNM